MGYLAQNLNNNYLEGVITGSAIASLCVEGFGIEALLQLSPTILDKRIKKIKKIMSEKK